MKSKVALAKRGYPDSLVGSIVRIRLVTKCYSDNSFKHNRKSASNQQQIG